MPKGWEADRAAPVSPLPHGRGLGELAVTGSNGLKARGLSGPTHSMNFLERRNKLRCVATGCCRIICNRDKRKKLETAQMVPSRGLVNYIMDHPLDEIFWSR